MDIFSIVLLAIGLAMDCLAVSVTNGIALKRFQVGPILKMAFLFGLFQGAMPFFGWLAGVGFQGLIESWDHWLAFGILAFLGVKMIIDGVKESKEESDESNAQPALQWKKLIMLAIATSIDALATGLVFVTTQTKIFIIALLIIGAVSFLFSVLGNAIGILAHKHLPFNMQVIGGIVLIFIGVKIIAEHLQLI